MFRINDMNLTCLKLLAPHNKILDSKRAFRVFQVMREKNFIKFGFTREFLLQKATKIRLLSNLCTTTTQICGRCSEVVLCCKDLNWNSQMVRKKLKKSTQ
jgi:hypothetical protein